MRWRYVVIFWMMILLLRGLRGGFVFSASPFIGVAICAAWLAFERVRNSPGNVSRTIGVILLTVLASGIDLLATYLRAGGMSAAVAAGLLVLLLASCYLFSFRTTSQMKARLAAAAR